MDTSPHKSDFVNVNGIRLHYLDWGGVGPSLLFLAGLGCNAHIFDRFAPRFTSHFHVLGLTRRGHGESDYPVNGYDIDTLTEDIRLFIDDLNLDQIVLVGHSLAGIELSHFAVQYPQRIQKLVYLDAAYYRSTAECKAMLEKNPMKNITIPGEDDHYNTPEELSTHLRWAYPSFDTIWSEMMDEHHRHEVQVTPEGKVIWKMSDEISTAINDMVSSYPSEDSKITAPVLSIYADKPNTYLLNPNYMTEDQQAQLIEFYETIQRPWNMHCIEQFKQNLPNAKIVLLPNAHHYCFIQQEERVFMEVMSFLQSSLENDG